VDPNGHERATNPSSSGAASVGFCGRRSRREHDIYQENAVCEYPQSGERILGTGHHERIMIMDAVRNVLTRLQQQGAALGHFNVADLVLLKAVVAAAGPWKAV
jgi:hypothetical protein